MAELSPRGGRKRAGTHVLRMATNPVQRQILQTMLTRGVKVRLDRDVYDVSPQGREALFVSFVAERWLHSAPRGPLDFDGPEAEAAVLALTEGWQATLIHALAREPLNFKQLNDAVGGIRPSKVRRLLKALRSASLVEAVPGVGEGACYAVTDWLRAGLAPLIAAARVERRQEIEEAAPIDALDVEAAFHLSLPMLELPEQLTGACRLGVNLRSEASAGIHEAGPGMDGVTVRVEQGRVVSCAPGLDLRADTWGAGTAPDWLDTVIEPDAKRIRTGGDRQLAAALLRGLHEKLFGIPVI